MNLSWPDRAVGKAMCRSAARVLAVGATAVTLAGAAAMVAPAVSAMAATHTVKHATTTTMSAVSGYVGTKVTLSAKVKGGTLPKGTVKFAWGGKTLCSATLSNGTASCGHVFGAVGSLRVEAEYAGNATHKASTGVATVKVLALKTSVKVTASPAAATTGKAMTFTAVVSPSAATGTVTFSDAAGKLGTAKVVAGKASLKYTWNAGGSYTVTAAYGGDAKDLRSSGSTTVTVAAVYATTTVITIDADANSPTLNWETAGNVTVPFTVKNNTPGGPAPTGTVTISDPPDIPDQPANPAFTGCSGKLTPGANGTSTGECTVATPTEAWGFVLMRATYNPSTSGFITSNTGDTEYKIINLMVTGTSVAPAAATAGTPVTLIATVLPAGPAAASANTAGGNLLAAYSETGGDLVSFTAGGTAIAGCTDVALLWNATTLENYAECTTTLAAGSYDVAAVFSGDEYAATSTGTETLVVAGG